MGGEVEGAEELRSRSKNQMTLHQRLWMVLSELRIKVGGHEVAGQVERREAVGEEEHREVLEVAQHLEAVGQVSTKGAGLEAVEPDIAQQPWLVA